MPKAKLKQIGGDHYKNNGRRALGRGGHLAS